MDKKGGKRVTLITPSAAAMRKEKNFVIDENLSLVGYVMAVKLNSSESASGVDEELESRMNALRVYNETLCADDIVIEGME